MQTIQITNGSRQDETISNKSCAQTSAPRRRSRRAFIASSTGGLRAIHARLFKVHNTFKETAAKCCRKINGEKAGAPFRQSGSRISQVPQPGFYQKGRLTAQGESWNDFKLNVSPE